MKINIKFHVLALVILICISNYSCSDSNQKLNTFLEYKRNVKSAVFEKFPVIKENFDTPYVLTVVNPSSIKRGYSGVFITYLYENEIAFINEIEGHSKLAKNKIEIGGKEAFIVPDSLTREIRNRIPVPSLDDEFNFLDKLVSEEDSRFFIFNYGEGDFFKPPFKIQSEEYSRQGFSNGCIVDDKNRYITYWTMVW
ncbi:MAG: hypothetical protein AAGC43_16835 [Bacteroidota bacterium]